MERELTQVLLDDDARAVGYLLKEQVMDVDDFFDALDRAHAGGPSLDPDVVRRWSVSACRLAARRSPCNHPPVYGALSDMPGTMNS
jgi:DNA-binding NarL/FixJ family response regulator